MITRNLLSASFRLIGVLASGEAPSANEASDALGALKRLIDSWSTENLLVPNKVREVFALTPGQQTYTMGTGGDFDTDRPLSVENALVQVQITSPTLEIPVGILNKDEYAGVILKTLQSTYPLYLYPDGDFPLTNLNFWPVPSGSNNVVLYSWKPLAVPADLDTDLVFPPGYERALIYGMALELAPEYGKTVSELVGMNAAEAKASIKRANKRTHYLRVDPALQGKPSVWNWLTGGPT